MTDVNATVKHVSMGEMRRRHDRQQKLTVKIYWGIFYVTVITMFVSAVWQAVQR